MRCRAGLLAVLVATAALAGCSGTSNSISREAAGSGGQYGSGDQRIDVISAADRRTVIRVSGRDLEGKATDSASYRGKVLVLNKWASWCPPCNAEAPALQQVWDGYTGKDVQFLGVGLRESPQTALAFQRKFAITYPSLAYDGGAVLLQLRGQALPTPTTLVVDREGRLAARVSGEVTAATLRGLINDVLAEGPATP